MTFTWSNGRNLQTVSKGSSSIGYAYDSDSNRTSKTVDGAYTQYIVVDGVLFGERRYNNTGFDLIIYLYDENGDKYGFTYNGTEYYYQTNLQGDVVGIYDSTGQLVVQYAYDAWGKLLSATGTLASTIGQINPIRYRGYYYDTETGFYYLQSRYYDPETGRFINADGYVSTGQGILSYNMFAYCLNDPIRFADDSGTRCVEDRPDGRWVMATNSGNIVSGGGGSPGRIVAAPSLSSKDKLKKEPTALTHTGNNFTTYANESDASVIARMLYGEDSNSANEHLWVLENRRIAGGYGGTDFRSLVLAEKQFSCMSGRRSLNPGSYFKEPTEVIAWEKCVDAAYNYIENGIQAIPNKFKNPYTWTHKYYEGIEYRHPIGEPFGGTWFYCK